MTIKFSTFTVHINSTSPRIHTHRYTPLLVILSVIPVVHVASYLPMDHVITTRCHTHTYTGVLTIWSEAFFIVSIILATALGQWSGRVYNARSAIYKEYSTTEN